MRTHNITRTLSQHLPELDYLRMDQSHFGRLCPELRNRIYHLVLEEEDPIAISQESAVEAEAALLRTCRQIREESELIFYAVNNFSCTIHSIKDKVPHLTDWLQTGPPQKLALIRSLEVRCEFPVNVMRAMRIAARRDVLKVAVLHRPGPGSPTLVRPLFKDLRTYSFGTRRIEQVVKFTVNGTSDDAPEVDMNTLIYGKE